MSFDVEMMRSRFPSLSTTDNKLPRIYFDNPGGTQVTQSVVDAMTECLIESNANVQGSFVTSKRVDSIYENALNAGALGGKLLGAGGGGYFLFFAKPEMHKNIKKRLHKFQCIDFDFSDEGSANYIV